MKWKRIKWRYFNYLKTSGTCAVVIGGCWIFYQLRLISKTVSSVVATDVLQLEQSQAQYIYLDDPQLADIIFQNNIDLQYYIKKNRESIFNKISAWWKSLTLSRSYVNLKLAQLGSTRAIYALGKTKNLKDWHYRQMAQTLDAKTAVALARIPKVDLRFFLNPPYSHEKCDLTELIEGLQHLLSELNDNCKGRHLCLSQFLNKNCKNLQHDVSIFEHDLVSVGLAPMPRIIYDLELLKNCIFAIYHHTSLEQYSKDMIKAGGLLKLMKVQMMYGDNLDICILLAKILANVSLNSDCLETVYQTGWIKILAKWSQHENVQLSVTASKALANLDNDANDKFSQNIYLLHPVHRVHAQQKLDVIFIHGLLGGVFITWRQRDKDSVTKKLIDEQKKIEESKGNGEIDSPQFIKDLTQSVKMRDWKNVGSNFEIVIHDCPEYSNCSGCGILSCPGDDPCFEQERLCEDSKTQCWPKDWLSTDTPNIRVLGIDYATNLSMWTPFCPIENMKRTLKDRSDELTEKLMKAGVGKRPIIWVCHSMGGLLVKNMLIEEWKNSDKHELCKNTRGIVFYSTPHKGSYVASLAPATKLLLSPSIEVQELQENSPELLAMHTDFLKLLKQFPIDIVSFSETKPTVISSWKYHFVTSESADAGIGEFYAIPQDHLSICKPANRQSFLYQKMLSMVKHYIAVS